MTDSLDRLRAALADRYVVEREIGRGGTATVYVATDLRHDRPVALKVLRPELAAAIGPERFLAEIRITAGLTHPHILPVLNSGDAGGFIYYVMPFVEGESLRDRLDQQKQLPLDDALLIAREVSDALSYAHSRGVVHRDIKPSNILLGSGHAVVADFGIARAIHAAAGARLTETGIAIGTPSYMSPEQATGAKDLDGRADLYSLGCVLYEMLAGVPPFAGPTAGSLLHQHITAEPPKVIVFRPTVPTEVAEAINTALAKVPADRFANAGQFNQALAASRLPTATQPRKRRATRAPSPGARMPRRLRLAAAAVGLLAIASWSASPPGRRALSRLASALVPAAPRFIAVLSFTSTDTADAVLAAGLTESFTKLIELAYRTDSVWVLSNRDMLDQEASTPAGLRHRLPVDLVVTGEVVRVGGDPSLNVELHDVRRNEPRLLSSLSIPDPLDSLSLASAEALLGGAPDLPPRSGSSDASSAAWAASPARRYYLLGTGQMQRAYDLASLDAAIGLFQAAINEDASFGAAYAGLCEAFWERYLQTGEAGLANDAVRLCDRAGELSRSDPAALVALGRTQFFQGQLERSERTLREAIRRNAGADAHRWLGHVLEDLGRFDEAEREHRQAINLQPDVWIYYAALGQLYMNAERQQEAIKYHRKVIELSPDNYVGYNNLGASMMLMHRLDDAEEQLRQSIRVRPTSLAYRNLGYLAILRHRYDDAVVTLRQAISFGNEDWWNWRWLAHAHHLRADRAAEREAWQRVVDLLELRLEFNPDNQDMLCGMAEALVALGETERGRRYLDYLASLDIVRPYNLYWMGRVYEMLGSRRTALQYVSQALGRGVDARTIASDPWLDDLRADPAYQGPQAAS